MNSHTVDVTGNTNSTGASSGGTETPVKKAKIILTEKEQTFASLFAEVTEWSNPIWKTLRQDTVVNFTKAGNNKFVNSVHLTSDRLIFTYYSLKQKRSVFPSNLTCSCISEFTVQLHVLTVRHP